MTLFDKIAYKFGYVKAPKESTEHIPNLNQETLVSNTTVPKQLLQTPPSAEEFGFLNYVEFDVICDGQLSPKRATWEEMLDFVDSCDVDLLSLDGDLSLAQVVAGVPFEIDDHIMVFRVRSN